MAFGVYKSNGSESSGSDVDFEAMNKHIVETAALQQPETLIGFISSIVDVGIQEQEDGKMESDLSEEQEVEAVAAAEAKGEKVYFETLFDYESKKDKRYRRFPLKAAQCVVVTVDFPDIMVDKGQFFGESEPKPLRLLMGGEFQPSGSKRIAAKPLALNVRKNEKTNNKWSMPFNHTLYKMAVAAKIVNQGDPFVPDRIDELLGKALQFKAQVYMKDDKYFTEKCAFAAGLARGQKEPVVDQSLLSMIQFKEENAEDQLKMLRASIKNTMRKAANFADSKIKDQIGVDSTSSSSTAAVDTPKEVKAPKEKKAPVEVPDYDDTVPF